MTYENIIDIESAKERFMGNYAMFSKFLFQFPQRSMFSQLKSQVEAGDVKQGFETAHAMKGVASNLSLKLMEKPMSDVVESLRAGSLPDGGLWAVFSEAYGITVDAIDRLSKEGTVLF